MSDVVDLEAERKGRRLIWVCSCGCTVFRCFADGAVECAECETVAVGYQGEWRVRLPDEPAAPREVDETCFKVVQLDSGLAFLRRRLNTGEEPIASVVITREGISTFADKDAVSGALDWLWDELTEAVRRMAKHFREG